MSPHFRKAGDKNMTQNYRFALQNSYTLCFTHWEKNIGGKYALDSKIIYSSDELKLKLQMSFKAVRFDQAL